MKELIPPVKLLCNIQDVIQVSGLGRSKIYQYILSGELRSVKAGRRRLIPADAIPEFIEKLSVDPEASS